MGPPTFPKSRGSLESRLRYCIRSSDNILLDNAEVSEKVKERAKRALEDYSQSSPEK